MPTLDTQRWIANALLVLPRGSLVTATVPKTGRDGNPTHTVFIEGGKDTNAAQALDMLSATQCCLDRQIQTACSAIAADTNMKLDDMLEHFRSLVEKHQAMTAQDHESSATVERRPNGLERMRRGHKELGLGGIGP